MDGPQPRFFGNFDLRDLSAGSFRRLYGILRMNRLSSLSNNHLQMFQVLLALFPRDQLRQFLPESLQSRRQPRLNRRTNPSAAPERVS